MGGSSKDDAKTVTTAPADLKTGLTHPQSGNLSAGKSCFSLSVLETRTLTNCTYYYLMDDSNGSLYAVLTVSESCLRSCMCCFWSTVAL